MLQSDNHAASWASKASETSPGGNSFAGIGLIDEMGWVDESVLVCGILLKESEKIQGVFHSFSCGRATIKVGIMVRGSLG